VEGAVAQLYWFRRVCTRWEIRDDVRHAFVIGCAVICLRQLRGFPVPAD
jgi:hypothetical protein